MKWNYSSFSNLSDNSKLCLIPLRSCGICGMLFFARKSSKRLSRLRFLLWNILPRLWNACCAAILRIQGNFFVEEGYSLPLSNTISIRGNFPLPGNLSQLSDNFPQFSQFMNTELFHDSPMKGGFSLATSRAKDTPFHSLW